MTPFNARHVRTEVHPAEDVRVTSTGIRHWLTWRCRGDWEGQIVPSNHRYKLPVPVPMSIQ